MRFNGGIIGGKKAVSTGAASGIWSLAQAQREKGASNWPGLTVLPTFTYTGTYETQDFGGYRYAILTSGGIFALSDNRTIEVTSAGGGGSGSYGCAYGGGSGGGELDIWVQCAITAPVTVTIGSYGSPQPYQGTPGGGNGGTTSFGGFTSSLGGGHGNQSFHGTAGGSGGGGGGGGGYNQNAGSASGSNTNAGGAGGGFGANNYYAAGGGGGATSAGQAGTSSGTGGGNGGEGYALATLDSNLTSANFPSTLTGKTHICSGGGGALQLNGANPPFPRGGVGGTNGGDGARTYSGSTPIAGQEMSAATSYGCGGGHGYQGSTASMGLGMGGVVIVKMT